jgi:hypothetical protein
MVNIDELSEKDVRTLAKNQSISINFLCFLGIMAVLFGGAGWLCWALQVNPFDRISDSTSESAALDLLKNSGAAVRMTCSGEGVVFDGENLTANKSNCEIVIGKTAPGASEVKIITG